MQLQVKNLQKKMYGADFPYKEIRKLADDLEREHIRNNGVPIKNGLYNLLERLKKNGVLIALATSSRKEIAAEYLVRAKVMRCFDVLVCGDEVEHGKPNPEIFLKAAYELNCDPENCIIVEDSQNGLKAAIAAGANPVFIKDIKDVDRNIKENVYRSYDKLTEFLEEIIPYTQKLQIPDVYDSFPLNEGYEIAGIHGFGAIGGGYLAQIFTHWDGYTRPPEIIGATQNLGRRQLINSIGKYRVRYESLAFFQTIENVHLIDIDNETAVVDMYERSHIIGLALPEKVIPLQAVTIAKALLNRYEKGLEKLTILIVMNKINAARYVKKYVEKALQTFVDEETVKKVMKSAYFCETVVNRMVSATADEDIALKLKNDLHILYQNMFEYSDDIKKMLELAQYFTEGIEQSAKKKKHKDVREETINISNNLEGVSHFIRSLYDINFTMFTAEQDMPIYASNESPLLKKLRQVVVIDDIRVMQEIKNKLSNGTHAIIAWYSYLLGYDTIGQGMGDARVEKLANEIMINEIRPSLLAEHKEPKGYINSFISNFIKRCRVSFKDSCTRVGREPMRKIQVGERVIGAISLANEHNCKSKSLEFGAACAILYSLKVDKPDKESLLIRTIYSKNNSVGDILTYNGPYNKSKYKGLDREKDKALIERIQHNFDLLKVEIEKEEKAKGFLYL